MAYDFRAQSAYSDPGRHAGLLDPVPTDPAGVSELARNVIVHYRAPGLDLPAEHRDEIHSRWLAVALDHDQDRHPGPLATPRDELDRVLGCCRDHCLLVVSALRHHGVPARSRVGFADYFAPEFHHDHVIVELHDGARWRRFDPELSGPTGSVTDPTDIPPGVGFATGGEVWQAIRAGAVDPQLYGAVPGTPLAGAWFVQGYVLLDLAARFGHEMLLWDGFGSMSSPDGPTDAESQLADEVAALLAEADADPSLLTGPGDEALLARFTADDRLRPGDTVTRMSPYGDPPVRERVGARP